MFWKVLVSDHSLEWTTNYPLYGWYDAMVQCTLSMSVYIEAITYISEENGSRLVCQPM